MKIYVKDKYRGKVNDAYNMLDILTAYERKIIFENDAMKEIHALFTECKNKHPETFICNINNIYITCVSDGYYIRYLVFDL